MKIYLDMDDVVADWLVLAQQILGKTWDPGERIPQHEWDTLKENERFYFDLPLKEGAHELVHWALQYQKTHPETCSGVRFLTALPHDYTVPFAAQDKVWWAHRYFPGVPVFFGPFSHDKWRHCKPGDLLIDDRHSNCSEWRAAGGIAHEYTTWKECRSWLKENFE
jgi:hypothetical protein